MRIGIGVERLQHHGVLRAREFSAREVPRRQLHRQRIGLGRHGEDEMKRLAHRGIREDRHPAIAPFGFEIRHRVGASDHPLVLVFEDKLLIP